MKDVDSPPDEGALDVRPDDPAEQKLYGHRLRARYRSETAGLDDVQVASLVRESLRHCPALRIRDSRDVLRFIALRVVVTPAQKDSPFIGHLIRTVLGAVDDWSATKRLDFIYRHIVGRPAPEREPDYGPWYAESRP